MIKKRTENNRVKIIGEVISGFTYCHTLLGEDFYTVDVAVERLSTTLDILPVMVSERLIDVHEDYTGVIIEVEGQLRSYNRFENDKNRLYVTVFAKEIYINTAYKYETITNQVILDGFICKPPVYRRTPSGREVTDIMLGVHRLFGKTDYIPCIVWGRNASYIAGFEVGENVKLEGRIQSRVYTKTMPDKTKIRRTTYEVSASWIDIGYSPLYF